VRVRVPRLGTSIITVGNSLLLAGAVAFATTASLVAEDVVEDQRSSVSIAVVTDGPGDGRSTFEFEQAASQIIVDIAPGQTRLVGSIPATLVARHEPPWQLVDPGPTWRLADISCDDTDSPLPSRVNLADRSVEPGFVAGGDVTCTYLLEDQRSSVSIDTLASASLAIDTGRALETRTFEVDPFNGLLQWFPPLELFAGAPTEVYPPTLLTAPLEIIGGRLIGPLDPTESVTISCDDADSPTPSSGHDASRSVTFGLDPGEHVTCTYHLVPTHTTDDVRFGIRVEAPLDGSESYPRWIFDLGEAFVPPPRSITEAVFGSGLDREAGTVSVWTGATRWLEGTFLLPLESLDDPAGPGRHLPVTMQDPGSDYVLDHIACDDPGTTADVASATARYGVVDTPDITCTFFLADTLASILDGGSADDEELVDDDDDDAPEDSGDADQSGPTPKAGRWQSKQTDGSVNCPFPIKAADVGSQSGKLAVKSGGEKLVGSGFGGNKKLTLKRDKSRPDHYVGKTNVREGGAKGKLSVDWTVESPEHMVGTNKLVVKIQGETCTITRTFEMTHQGQ
jgi:hypothetical protein